MNLISQWQCLSVEKFFKQANWDGKSQQSSQNLPRSSSSNALRHFHPAVTTWGSWTVQDFFKAQNWMGQPLDSDLFIHDQDTFVPVLTAVVQDFFQYLPWEGPPTIAHSPEIPTQKSLGLNWAESEDDFTLTDLSDLF